MIEKIKEEVIKSIGNDKSGHNHEHSFRVYETAMMLAEEENANKDVVALSALLHDVDDYKLVAEEDAIRKTNARRIMKEVGVDEKTIDIVCETINDAAYENIMSGFKSITVEKKVLFEADSLDAIGSIGIARVISYCNNVARPFFNKDLFPKLDLSREEYLGKGKYVGTAINHFFEKLLKVKNMMFTQAAKKEASYRHNIMVEYLMEFFREQNCSNWIEYLDNFEKTNK